MKWILAILLLISVSAIGQTDDPNKYIRYQNQYGMRIPRLWSDSVLRAMGLVKFPGVGSTNDTSAFKPLSIDGSGNVYRMIGWPGSTSGGSATLSNVGSGYRLVKTSSGQVKTWFFGYGTTGDSSSNTDALTIKVDTTTGNHLITQSDLNDTAAALRTDLGPKNLYGLIYAKGSWTTIAGDFDNNGADTSISGGKILLQPAGSNGTFTQSIGLKNPTCLEHWRMLVQYTLKSTPSSTTYGLGVGIRSTNTHVTSSVLTYTDLTTDGTNGGKVFHAVDYPTPAVLETSTGSLAKSLNDQFETIIERIGDKIVISNRNLTTNSAIQSTEHTYSTLTAPATELLPNTGKFSLFAIGGLIQIDSLSVFSKEMKGADMVVLADSKRNYYAKKDSNWVAQIRPSFNGVVALSGPGDRPQDIYDRKDELIALQPKQVILECGTNESDSSVVKTYIQKLNDTLVAHGIRVIHTAFYQTSPSTLWRHNYITRTFPIVIDNYNPMNQPNTVNADDIHPSQYGHNIIASNTLSSGKLLYGKYYTPMTSMASGSTSGSILDGTSPQTADFNITGGGTASSWTTSGSAPITLSNTFGSSNDGVAFFRTTGSNKTSNLYLSPNGSGSGGNLTSFAMFNADVTTSPSNFGFASFQMKGTEFDLYTSNVGSGTLVPLKLGTGGSTFQLTLNTNGTTTVNGNAHFFNQVAIGPSFTSPFSKALLHAHKDVNDALYIMASNNSTGASGSVGFKATLNQTTDTADYVTMMALSQNFSAATRPKLGGASSLIESTLSGNMIISNYNDTGSVVVTTKKSMEERMRIDSTGKVSIEQMDSTAIPANMVWRDPVTHKLKLAAVPTGGGTNSFLDKQYTTTQNSGTSITDMYTYTIPGNTLATDGDIVDFETSGYFIDATSTPEVTMQFNGGNVLGTGPQTIAGTTHYSVKGRIIRTSSTTARVTTTIQLSNGVYFTGNASPSSLDFTSGIVLRLLGQATGAGGSTGDILGHFWTVEFKR